MFGQRQSTPQTDGQSITAPHLNLGIGPQGLQLTCQPAGCDESMHNLVDFLIGILIFLYLLIITRMSMQRYVLFSHFCKDLLQIKKLDILKFK